MLQPSLNATGKAQPDGAGPHFGPNNNFALSQASVFYAGQLFGSSVQSLLAPGVANFLGKFGVFFQGTYSGVERKIGWDNVEIRFADQTKFCEMPAKFGFYLNNNPSMQDPWNTLPVWTFPFSSSKLAPTPAAATLLEGGLAQQVLGLGAYTFLGKSIYLDVAGYKTTSPGFQKAMGAFDPGEKQVSGVAPYWRVAYSKSSTNQSFEAGAFGLSADNFPGRDRSSGKDRISDWGLDSQYQVTIGQHAFTSMVSRIYEKAQWRASLPLGSTAKAVDRLTSTKAGLNYIYNSTYGGFVGYFKTNGTTDELLYANDSVTNSPKSDGMIFQLNYMPFNKNGGPSFAPRSNVKFSLQYVMYNRFNGTSSNYNGEGRNARDNNTLYLETWIMF